MSAPTHTFTEETLQGLVNTAFALGAGLGFVLGVLLARLIAGRGN